MRLYINKTIAVSESEYKQLHIAKVLIDAEERFFNNKKLEIFRKVPRLLILWKNFKIMYTKFITSLSQYISPDNCTRINEWEKLQEFTPEQCEKYLKKAAEVKDQFVMIPLFGGIATSINNPSEGASTAKGLIEVDNEETILDVNLQHIEDQNLNCVIFDNLFISEQVDKISEQHAFKQQPNLFREIMHGSIMPRIDETTGELLLLNGNENDDENWAPPGHGDIWRMLMLTKTINNLLYFYRKQDPKSEKKIKYALIHNGENFTATYNPLILGYFAEEGKTYLVEVIKRAKDHIKCGFPAQIKNEKGKSIKTIIEPAQQDPKDREAFQDQEKFPVINTGSTWVNLAALDVKLREHYVADLLPVIANRKTVQAGHKVIQLEQSKDHIMHHLGQDGVCFLEVDNRRFVQVKYTSDIFLLRSNFAKFKDDGTIIFDPHRDPQLPNPELKFDDEFFNTVKKMDERIKPDADNSARVITNLIKMGMIGDFKIDKKFEASGKVLLINLCIPKNKESVQIDLSKLPDIKSGTHIFYGDPNNPKKLEFKDFNETIFERLNTLKDNKKQNGEIILEMLKEHASLILAEIIKYNNDNIEISIEQFNKYVEEIILKLWTNDTEKTKLSENTIQKFLKDISEIINGYLKK